MIVLQGTERGRYEQRIVGWYRGKKGRNGVDDVPSDSGDPAWPEDDGGCDCLGIMPIDQLRIDLCGRVEGDCCCRSIWPNNRRSLCCDDELEITTEQPHEKLTPREEKKKSRTVRAIASASPITHARTAQNFHANRTALLSCLSGQKRSKKNPAPNIVATNMPTKILKDAMPINSLLYTVEFDVLWTNRC